MFLKDERSSLFCFVLRGALEPFVPIALARVLDVFPSRFAGNSAFPCRQHPSLDTLGDLFEHAIDQGVVFWARLGFVARGEISRDRIQCRDDRSFVVEAQRHCALMQLRYDFRRTQRSLGRWFVEKASPQGAWFRAAMDRVFGCSEDKITGSPTKRDLVEQSRKRLASRLELMVAGLGDPSEFISHLAELLEVEQRRCAGDALLE